jgi:pyruvate/2-oxoglutarate dehydrogenase complex dihydrolipoamide dehydrogenase (E3) component
LKYDVFVIGGGSAGSEAALGLARTGGFRIGLAERDRLGGECTFSGCVPTKAMIRAATLAAEARGAGRFGVEIGSVEVDLAAVQARVRAIVASHAGRAEAFERAGVDVVLRGARIVGPHDVELDDGTKIEADRIVLATGSDAVVPPIPGLAEGPVWTNSEAIWGPRTVPGSLAVIGGGAIGIEFAQIYARFGARVTVLETSDHILPSEDADAAASLAPALEADGIDLVTGIEIERAIHGPDGWTLAGPDRAFRADEVLVSTGRRPIADEHDLDAAGVSVDERGAPLLDEHLRTTAPSVWAAGDATGELLFTHVANYEARVVVDAITGRPRPRDYRVVPRVTFSSPEVASVGVTERQAVESGEIRVGTVDLADNERAQIDDRRHGLVKVITDAEGRLVGGHIVAPEAGSMIHELVAMMAANAPIQAAAHAIHAYPTLSESMSAALRAASCVSRAASATPR